MFTTNTLSVPFPFLTGTSLSCHPPPEPPPDASASLALVLFYLCLLGISPDRVTLREKSGWRRDPPPATTPANPHPLVLLININKRQGGAADLGESTRTGGLTKVTHQTHTHQKLPSCVVWCVASDGERSTTADVGRRGSKQADGKRLSNLIQSPLCKFLESVVLLKVVCFLCQLHTNSYHRAVIVFKDTTPPQKKCTSTESTQDLFLKVFVLARKS